MASSLLLKSFDNTPGPGTLKEDVYHPGDWVIVPGCLVYDFKT
tara:strand:+ start:1458 stop:1586 length:129 start_codon:yes stop_codon:yes gene_type:complete